MSESGPLALFLDMQAVERGASANTLEAYRRDLTDFETFLTGRKRKLAEADTDSIRAYLADLSVRGFKGATVARRLSAIRQFYRFLFRKGSAMMTPLPFWKGRSAAARCPRC